VRLLELRDAFKLFIPASFEFTGHQAIVRVDAFVLALRQACVVPRLLELQLALPPLTGQIGPRRSPKLTHFCSREMTQTEITI
jgi:hypothetical protein